MLYDECDLDNEIGTSDHTANMDKEYDEKEYDECDLDGETGTSDHTASMRYCMTPLLTVASSYFSTALAMSTFMPSLGSIWHTSSPRDGGGRR